MVQIDIPAAFVASQLFLDLGRNVIQREPERTTDSVVYYRFLFRSVFFAGSVIAPCGIYLLAGWPGWEQLYWTARVENLIFQWVNALIPALFVLVIVAAGYLGHVVGYRWLVTGKGKYLRPTYLCVLAAVAILVLLNYPAFLVVGTYAEYHSNPANVPAVWTNAHDFVRGWLVIIIYFLVTLAYLCLKIHKESRNASTGTARTGGGAK